MIVMSSHGELFYTEVPLSLTASSSPSTTFSGKDLQHVANLPPDFKNVSSREEIEDLKARIPEHLRC